MGRLAENPKPATLCNFRKPSTHIVQLTTSWWGSIRRGGNEEEISRCRLPRSCCCRWPRTSRGCTSCYRITTVFSHAQTVVVCSGCSTVLCQSTGGRARLTEGCSFRKKSQK